MYKYNFIEHTADVAFEAEGDSLEDLFTASAFAWKETVLEKTVIEPLEQKVIELRLLTLEELLVYFLDELNFFLNHHSWVFSEIKKISVMQDKEWRLSAVILGEHIDRARHEIKTEIKAVTFHQMEVKEENGKFRTRVVFDI